MNLKNKNNLNEDINNPFHKHLDQCEQCRENPFALCNIGHILLKVTVDLFEFQIKRKRENMSLKDLKEKLKNNR